MNAGDGLAWFTADGSMLSAVAINGLHLAADWQKTAQRGTFLVDRLMGHRRGSGASLRDMGAFYFGVSSVRASMAAMTSETKSSFSRFLASHCCCPSNPD